MRTMTPQTIEISAGDIAAGLQRRGIGSDERVKLTIKRKGEIIPRRRESRARVVAACLTEAKPISAWMKAVVDRHAEDRSLP
jgi:hypothetical protein